MSTINIDREHSNLFDWHNNNGSVEVSTLQGYYPAFNIGHDISIVGNTKTLTFEYLRAISDREEYLLHWIYSVPGTEFDLTIYND